YTDSVLLQGVVAAPLIWLGLSNVAVYNLVLLFSIALSGWAMWKYAAHMTGSPAAAILAGIIFAFVPFRFDHYLHLELQATIFLPLTLLYFERTIETGSRRDAWLMMAAFAAQMYSCIYYAVFLATVLVPIALLRLWLAAPAARLAFVRVTVPAIVAAVIVIIPYAIAYGTNRGTLGDRLDSDIRLYSATWSNYLASTASNALYGATAIHGRPERYLFPGAIAVLLAVIGVIRFDRQRATLAVVGLCGLIISLGLNSPLYEALRAIVVPYRGLRAPARAAILVYLALAALAAFGWARLMRGRSPRAVAMATVAVAVGVIAEYRAPIDAWLEIPRPQPAVYRWLAQQPRSVVAEVPFAQADALHTISDGLYMFHSTAHWQPIVNGYSGFFPPTFMELAEHTRDFPDDRSIAYLKKRGVDLIVVHGGILGPEAFGEVTSALLARPDIEAMAQFQEQRGLDAVFRLRR
ncbi:MAG TPA: hypothetical protein VNT81_23900, partial [Vicinamibacterales bacterium]|nr:hypothetical protein [Vicinamibacterales bacterium]